MINTEVISLHSGEKKKKHAVQDEEDDCGDNCFKQGLKPLITYY